MIGLVDQVEGGGTPTSASKLFQGTRTTADLLLYGTVLANEYVYSNEDVLLQLSGGGTQTIQSIETAISFDAIKASGNGVLYTLGSDQKVYSGFISTDKKDNLIDQYTKLLLHADGDNNSTIFIDSSAIPKGIVTNGDAKIKTNLITVAGDAKIRSTQAIPYGNVFLSSASKKFGNTSACFDGTGDYVYVTDSADLNFWNGNFTIDCWVNLAALRFSVIYCQLIDGTNFVECHINATGALVMIANSAGVYKGVFNTANLSWNAGQWYHVSFVMNSGTFLFFRDGVQQATTITNAYSATMPDLAAIGTVGGYTYATTESIQGYIDEFRLSKGIARWTSNFTPPTSPYTTDSYTKLLLHFEGENNSNVFLDDSEARVYGKFGTGAGYFDGTGDYLSIPDSDDWNFGTGDFTIEGFFFPVSTTGTGVLFTSRTNGSSYGGFVLSRTNNALTTSLSMSSTGSSWNIISNTGSVSMNLNNWNHIVLNRSGASIMVFVNGVSDSSLSATSSLAIYNDSAPFKIGGDSDSNYFNGYVDEFRISKGIARWTSNFTPPTSAYSTTDQYDKLLLHFDGPDNSVNFDESSNGGAVGPKMGRGMAYFDGTGDYLTLADSTDWDFGTGDFTIDLLAKFVALPTASSFMYIVDQYTDTNNHGGFYLYNNAGTYRLYYATKSGGADVVTTFSNITLVTNTWYHLAIVRYGNIYKLFQNGTQIGADYTNVSANPDVSSALVIGSRNSSNYFNGYLDELRITKGLARWTSNFTPPTIPYSITIT